MASRKMGRRIAAVVAVFGIAMSTVSISGAQASSASVLACGAQSAKTPWKSGSTIWGEGFAGTCSGDYRIMLERSRWYGWENMAASVWIRPAESTYVTYNCSGSGTHTYRSVVWKSGVGTIATSGKFRTSC
ncbi:hypothetical protein [Nonomuraea sp. NPDC048826]|uniref:hypothetical protein n=1 Tax=Nonomuraea sp. NPDC048826 TaxID=3364347 RepID=UPI0037112458